jgi:hypothetical protein
MNRIVKTSVLLAALCLGMVSVSASSMPAPRGEAMVPSLATGAPTVFKVTVTKVEIYNGTSFVTLFTGSSQLDMVSAAGTSAFPGISALSLPAGTYTQLRITFGNTFTLKGSLASGGTTYYTTATTLSSDSASQATTVAGSLAEGTIKNPLWGALGDPVVQTINIGSVVVVTGTSYAPTVKFDVSTSLVLDNTGPVFYFTLAPVTVTVF